MKKLFLFLLLICFLFVGCKTTKDAGETLPPESQTQTSEQVEIEEVPPVEESQETQPSLEEVIEEQGDLPLPFDPEFDSENDEFTTEDEFYYGDDFVPENQEENQIPENTDIELENEPELIISDEFLSEEEFLETQLEEEISNEVETEIIENPEEDLETELDPELETENELSLEPENKNHLSENLNENPNSDIQENKDIKPELSQNIDKNEKLSENEVSKQEEIKNPQKNEEPITRKEIVEIVEDILSKNEENSGLTNQSELSESKETEKNLPSRTVYAAKNQTILVSYPGNNWVYLGELESKSIVAFRGKNFADNLTTFKISPQKEGETILHFYKLDAISGKYIDDYLEVVISPSIEDDIIQNTVSAPEYSYDMYLLNNENSQIIKEDNSPIVEVLSNDTNYNKEILNNSKNYVQNKNDESTNFNKTKPQEESATLNKELAEVEVVEEEPELLFLSDIFDDEETESEVVTSQSNDDVLFDYDLLNRAKTAYENKDFENALSLVNKFLELSNFSIDEALFLKGQILEKPFAQRNIRDALDCYKKIISSYPQSDFWDKSDERIKYIQRFYFNIR